MEGYKYWQVGLNVNKYGKAVDKRKKEVKPYLNKRLGRLENKKYFQYLYFKGNFSKSARYIREMDDAYENGRVLNRNYKGYKKYSLLGTNCAWMAIYTLNLSYRRNSRNYKYLNNLLYKGNKANWRIGRGGVRVPNNTGMQYLKETIYPNIAFEKISKHIKSKRGDIN